MDIAPAEFQQLNSIAIETSNRVANALAQTQGHQLVLAESCTCGLVAALLGQVPGISNHFCGSAVTYRPSLKQELLNVSSQTLEQFTAESIETTREMARGILLKTSEPTLSAAVTGHLGPGVDPTIDGQVFISVVRRNVPQIGIDTQLRLNSTTRQCRQIEAATHVLKAILNAIESSQ